MKLSLKILLNDTRLRIFYILLLIWIVAIYKNSNWQNIIFPLFSIILFSILDLTFHFIKTKKWYYPFSSMVSGLLIGFLIHYSQGIIILTTAVLLAFVSKQFIKIKKRHIFNPAAFGVVLSTLIFGSNASWWTTASGGISLFLILFMIPILYKLRRLQYTFTFLTGYFIFFTILQGPKAALSLTIDETVFLFAFIMLTEPMTSSIGKFWKWGFGLVVLAGVVVSSLMKISFVDPLLLSLLIANLLVRVTSK